MSGVNVLVLRRRARTAQGEKDHKAYPALPLRKLPAKLKVLPQWHEGKRRVFLGNGWRDMYQEFGV